VNKKTFTLALGPGLLDYVARFDDLIARRWPSLFAMGLRVALRRLDLPAT
jgi:hypothetical protein